MARMRTIKPEFFRDAKVGAVSRDARLLWAGIWTEADDHGRLLASAKHLAGAFFSFDDDATPKAVERWIQELATTSTGGRDTLIHLYEADGVRYLHVPKWAHQKVDHPQPPRYPDPPCCPPIREPLANESRIPREPDANETRTPREPLANHSRSVRVQGSKSVKQSSTNAQISSRARETGPHDSKHAGQSPNGHPDPDDSVWDDALRHVHEQRRNDQISTEYDANLTPISDLLGDKP